MVIALDRNGSLAQSFFVERRQFPNGVFVTSLELFFSSKDESVPVTLELRSTENGYPSKKMFTNSRVVLPPRKVNTTDNPRLRQEETATVFRFRTPVYLPPGEHAMVLYSPSPNYHIYLAELGQKRIGTDNIVSEQPYVGSVFKSQNGSTWTAYQLEDLMFRLNRAKFVESGSIVLGNAYRKDSTDAAVDLIFPFVNSGIPSNTAMTFTHSVDQGASFNEFSPSRYVRPANRFHITNSDQYKILATFSTEDMAITPIIDIKTSTITAIQKLINNGNISSEHIAITDGSSGYGANVTVDLIFGDNAGATVTATGYATSNAYGSLDDVTITSGGEFYINDMNVSPSSGNATFNFISEVDEFGGPVQAKYITRIANLIDGFEAGDLRLFIVATKPQGTDIKCYYKVKSPHDPEPFDKKRYQQFEQMTSNAMISIPEDLQIEYEFKPHLLYDKITYTGSDGTVYSTFDKYAIKIVLLSDNTTKNPTVYEMRCIALPGIDTDSA